MSENMKKISARALQALALGVLVGGITGFVRAVATISSNDYVGFDLGHLAAKQLFAGIARGSLAGLWLAAAVVAVVLLAYAIFRVLGMEPRRTWCAALVAPAFFALLLGGYYVNRHYLPEFFSWPSLLGNAVMGPLALGTLYLLAVSIRRHAGVSRPWTLLRRTAFIGLPVLVAGLLGAQAVKWAIAPSPPLERRPDVLVILIDALRTDRMSVFGHVRETTPNLERLAADGVLFTNTVSQAGWTKPAVASLFTGMYPRQHGIASSDWGRHRTGGQTQVDALSPKALTMAELLSNAGYFTAAIGENHHILRKTGFDQGFDRFQMEIEKDEHHTRSDELNRLYFDLLDQHSEERKFIYLHYIDVHWPYVSPPDFRGMYAGPPPETDYNTLGYLNKINAAAPTEYDPELLEHMFAAYDEGIRFVDHKIGEAIEQLKQRGLYEETMIVVLADHGEEFREHGKFGHGHSLYDELIRVPLIIKLPDDGEVRNQDTVSALVEMIDVMPTVLRYVGISPPDGLFGHDLFSGTADPDPAAFSERDNHVSIRTLEHKYIYDFDSGAEKLYDLIADPGEKNNLAAQRPELAQELRSRIFSWLELVDSGLSVESGKVRLDAESKKKLEALGYVD